MQRASALRLGCCLVAALVCFRLSAAHQVSGATDPESFVDIDDNGVYKFGYVVDEAEKEILIVLKLQGTGWAGVGFGNDEMMDADVYLTNFNATTGKANVVDAYSMVNGPPDPDPEQNAEPLESSQEDGVTTIRFKRKLDTGDSKDKVIKVGELNGMIFAWNPTNPTFGFHGRNAEEKRILIKASHEATTPAPSATGEYTLQVVGKDEAKPGKTIHCEWATTAELPEGALATDFVGVYPEDKPFNWWIAFEYLTAGAKAGKWSFTIPDSMPPGDYECRIQRAIGSGPATQFTLLADSDDFEVEYPNPRPTPSTTVKVSLTGINVNEDFVVTCKWTSTEPSIAGDMIGVYGSDESPLDWIGYQLIDPGSTSGEAVITLSDSHYDGSLQCRYVHRVAGTGWFYNVAISD